MEKYIKKFGHFPAWISLEKICLVCCGKRKQFSRFDLLTSIFIIFYSRLITLLLLC